MRSARLMKILTHFVDNKGKIRSGHGKILKTTNKTPITSGLLKRKSITIRTAQPFRRRHRSSNRTTLQHTSTGKKLKCILALTHDKLDGEDTSIPKK
jgi:hypothetical protein